MNDPALKEFSILAISEPYAWVRDGNVITAPVGHPYWTKLVPTQQHTERWAFRSMLWINKEIEATQIPVLSSDLTAALIRLRDRTILVISVYIEPQKEEALTEAICRIQQTIEETRRRTREYTDVILVGDFNRHDHLWGGDEVSASRQGEADPIIDLISEYALHTLLPKGTKTWQSGEFESTIDLILASAELADTLIKCAIHPVEHGSDHRAVETTLDIAQPERPQTQRLLFKNAPWNDIRTRVAAALENIPYGGNTQRQTDTLMLIVSEAVSTLTPKAKPSPYSKRWWNASLTQLRQVYTYWRNRARGLRRRGATTPYLEQQAAAAAKDYHEEIRRQKKAHWEEFLEEDANIWQAARYLTQGNSAAFDKIPPLVRNNGTLTQDETEQAEELLSTFFPPLPAATEEEEERPCRSAIISPKITLEEIEQRLNAMKAWKAPGEDGLPAVVWKQLWPVVKERVLILFQSSLDSGELPSQWRNAKIIPLKKPGRGDYTMAKSWRPISLLSTLGKLLEAIIAERISYWIEEWGLLPANHFGARKQRSAEQALLLLQEQIYTTWRSRKVLSLISFDIKGAYNGVFKDRLLQRLGARGIPLSLIRWIDAFCSNRTATIQANGYISNQRPLPQAGLPQGSPLSPILFLFFNADLVQHKINSKGGSIAFVDDYSAWVTGPTAEANRAGIEAIITQALEWESRSGATFEGNKTSIIHFTRHQSRNSTTPYLIKGELVTPKETAKILGVSMDTQLRYKQHIAATAAKGLLAALALKRLHLTSPNTTRRLFAATVAPVIDYASNV
jgi:endonuclease/exonuclease/phosphatase family metal-dependent hydrolase